MDGTAGYDRHARNPGGSRSPVLARHGMVCTSQPLATAAGLRMLQAGGNAVDAAVAAAAVLNVVEPHMTGIGGDVFALVYWRATGELAGLNASGCSPAAMDLQYLRRKGYGQMPQSGIDAVTVPGALDGWIMLLERFGSRSLGEILAPAVQYAEEGFPVSEIIANQWAEHVEKLASDAWAAATFLIDGRAPVHGEIFSNPNLARSLRLIADKGRTVFYEGEIAEKIAAAAASRGGVLSVTDLAGHRGRWVAPLSTCYKGYDVYELPPNGQGLAVLQMLNILEGFDLRAWGHNSADYLHHLVEAKRLAFADRDRYLGDPEFSEVPIDRLLSKAYAAERRRLIDARRARPADRPGGADESDTVYLAVVDEQGNAVSFINSLFGPFGSGIVAGDTGICLQNRGSAFVFDERSPNCIAPRKRPLHTIIPAMVLRDGKPYFVFGVMGGDNQPQAQVQVLLNLVEFGMTVQEAGEAPRFRHTGAELGLESGIGPQVRRELALRGHKPVTLLDGFGGYQGILIDPRTGVLAGGSDPRKDGCAMGW